MANGEKEELQSPKKKSIMLTNDEARIILNLRRYAILIPNADLACLITNHNGRVVKGLLCLEKGPDSNIKL